MTQPPIPPRGGDEPSPGDDDPTRRLPAPAPEGQRNPTQQFGRPRTGPPGEPQYGHPPYGQPQYGPPPYGQQSGRPPGQLPYPEYGQAPYGQPPYGQPAYGQPPYPQYGQPPQLPWGPPGGPAGQPPRKNRNTTTLLVVGAVLLLAVIAAGLFFLTRAGGPDAGAAPPGDASEPAGAPSEQAPAGGDGIPSATMRPDGLGDDPDLDALAQGCYDGDMQACDDLYQIAEPDSLYGLYGGTCAGRQDVADADTIFCTSAFPED